MKICRAKEPLLETDKIDVGNNGYVRFLEVFGNELTIVNAARASFAKEKTELDENDIKLISFLVKHKHDSVFRHNVMSFEVKCPLEVKNQWWKHVIASTQIDDQYGWNESSRRYVTEEPDFFMPEVFKQSPENSKQGRSDEDHPYSEEWKSLLAQVQEQGLLNYHNAINSGVAPEQARLFLPAYGMNVTFRWTASLQAILNFLTLRLGDGAQKEISDFGRAVEVFVATCFPYTYQAWKENRI